MAHVIAMDVYAASKPFFDRGEDPPSDILDKCFHRDTSGLRGGSLSQAEKMLMATTLVPKALAAIRNNIEMADDKLMRSIGVVDQLLRAAA